MIGGGILLLFVDQLYKQTQSMKSDKSVMVNHSLLDAFRFYQILLPGFSRSAATIIVGISQHLTRRLAAEFSFFIAVPTMFAASLKSFYDVYKDHHDVLVKENMSY